jgi:hypothetical protein
MIIDRYTLNPPLIQTVINTLKRRHPYYHTQASLEAVKTVKDQIPERSQS